MSGRLCDVGACPVPTVISNETEANKIKSIELKFTHVHFALVFFE